MQQNIEETLKNVLEIVGYQGRKETFSDKFIQRCYQRALQNMQDTLPIEQKDHYYKLLDETTEPDKLKEIFVQLTLLPEFEVELKNATASIFEAYIESINPTLGQDQRKKLQAYLSSISASQAA